MASFYNAETSEPVSVMYIASSGNGNIMKAPGLTGLSMRTAEWSSPTVAVSPNRLPAFQRQAQ